METITLQKEIKMKITLTAREQAFILECIDSGLAGFAAHYDDADYDRMDKLEDKLIELFKDKHELIQLEIKEIQK